MALDRQAALAYAQKYWNRACEDGKIGIPSGTLSVAAKRKEMNAPAADGWEVFFVHEKGTEEKGIFRRTKNGTIEDKPDVVVTKDDLQDCSHYVSHCIQHGGIKVHESLAAADLIRQLDPPKVPNPHTKVLARRTTRSEGQKIIDSGVFKPGDVIGFWKKLEGENYHHSAMFTGPATSKQGVNGGLTCHSWCRYGGLTAAYNGDEDDAWFLYEKEGQSYTLIHFSDDDTPLMVPTMKWMSGWWQLGNEFYFVHANGTAVSTPRKPKSATDRPHMPPHHHPTSAQLFQGHDTITFIWRIQGKELQDVRVEKWAVGVMAQPTVKVQIEALNVSASRVF